MSLDHWLMKALTEAIDHEAGGENVADFLDEAMELRLNTDPLAKAIVMASLRTVARESLELAERLMNYHEIEDADDPDFERYDPRVAFCDAECNVTPMATRESVLEAVNAPEVGMEVDG